MAGPRSQHHKAAALFGILNRRSVTVHVGHLTRCSRRPPQKYTRRIKEYGAGYNTLIREGWQAYGTYPPASCPRVPAVSDIAGLFFGTSLTLMLKV